MPKTWSTAELPAHLDAIPAAARERLADNLLDLIATALYPTKVRRFRQGWPWFVSSCGSRGISTKLFPLSALPADAGFRPGI